MSTCVGECHVWRPEIGIRYLILVLSTLLVETGSLTGPRAPNCLNWLVSKFRESTVSGPPRLACKIMFFAWDFYILFLSSLSWFPLIVARSLMGHSGPFHYFLNIHIRSLTNTFTSAHCYDRHMTWHARKDLRSLAYIHCREVVSLFSHSSWDDRDRDRGHWKSWCPWPHMARQWQLRSSTV